MAVRIIEEEIALNQNLTGVVLTDGLMNLDNEIARYAIPAKTAIKIRPTDTFDCYIADNVPAGTAHPIDDNCQVTLLTTDPMGRREHVIAQAQYMKFSETRDKMQIYFMKTTVKLTSDFIIKLKVNSLDHHVSKLYTRFNLTCLLAYETLD